MKRLFPPWIVLLALITAWSLNAAGTNQIATRAPASLELRDQFDVLQRLAFPATNLTLLTLADKPGAEQLAEWIAPIEKRFGTRIDIRGIAELSTVPRPLRGLVRREFQRLLSYRVMMDWSGAAVKAFTYFPGEANVLVLDRQGAIVHRVTGQATPAGIRKVSAVIERLLAQPNAPPGKK